MLYFLITEDSVRSGERASLTNFTFILKNAGKVTLGAARRLNKRKSAGRCWRGLACKEQEGPPSFMFHLNGNLLGAAMSGHLEQAAPLGVY